MRKKGKEISNYMKIRGNRVVFMHFTDPHLGYKMQGLVRTWQHTLSRIPLPGLSSKNNIFGNFSKFIKRAALNKARAGGRRADFQISVPALLLATRE